MARLIDAEELLKCIKGCDYNSIEDLIAEQPTVEPIQWHKANELPPRMTNKSYSYDVLISSGDYTTIGYYSYKSESWRDIDEDDYNVIAWTELPKYEEV